MRLAAVFPQGQFPTADPDAVVLRAADARP